jgi:hypothetical protein
MSLFVQGLHDCNKGIPPQREDEAYLNGYGRAYEMSEMITAQVEQELPQ